MEFKRRSTFRDKVISVLGTLMAILLWLNAFEMWQRTGKIEILDIGVGIIAFGIATVFTNIKRFTYLRFEKDKLIWYRAMFLKKQIRGEDIKEIKAKMNHIILIDQSGKEIWLPMAFVREKDGPKVIEKIKKL